MNGRKRLIALSGTEQPPGEAENAPASGEEYSQDSQNIPAETEYETGFGWEEEEEEELPGKSFGWIVPALALLAIAGWTAFFGWVHRREMLAGASPESWIAWIGDWSLPVLLVIGLWLLAMRNSRREAARFGETARLLSTESAALEKRLAVVNRELSLARDFIASQSRDLESLGRVAGDRLSEHADRLQGLIRDNGEQVDAIGAVSDRAVGNMDRLRDQLPVISNAARDVTNQIGNAGNIAQDRLGQLVSGFERLNHFGEASGRQVEELSDKIDTTLAAFEAQLGSLETSSGARFDALRDQSDTFRVELEGRETDTLAAIRRRAEALGEELATHSAENASREEEAIVQMRGRLEELRVEGVKLTETMREGQQEAENLWLRSIEHFRESLATAAQEVSRIDEAAITNARKRLEALSESAQRVDARIVDSAEAFETEFARRRALHEQQGDEALEALEARLANFDRQVAERQEEHLGHMSALAERGENLSGRLRQLDELMAHLASQGSGESEKLGQAGDLLTERVSQSRAILEESNSFVSRLTDDSVRLLEIIRASADHSEGDLSQAIERAEIRLAGIGEQASELHRMVSEAEDKGSLLSRHLGRASQDTEASREALEALEARIASLAERSEELATKSLGELEMAIAALEEASGSALSKLRTEQSDALREIGERIGAQSSEAIEKALKDGAAEAIAELEGAARLAGDRGRETTIQLRDQLAKVNELAGNLEQRVAQARQQAEEQVDSDFSRRMALITESLNSAAIDISKAFDTEVTDTAWAGYLRGDRSIFTRRAVRLLDGQEMRRVSEIYEEDSEFRETVNRYIHDYEAMLRTVLSTRDGNSLAVTLLSSDMGKLYVALAQAIERLRN